MIKKLNALPLLFLFSFPLLAQDKQENNYDEAGNRHGYWKEYYAVSYTHLTLPTKRIV